MQILVPSVLFLLLAFGCVQDAKSASCDTACKGKQYSYGVCTGSGSGTGSQCSSAGGVDITNRSIPIPGCDFESIGAWDECCCFIKNK